MLDEDCDDLEGSLPGRWVGPGQSQRLAGAGLDAICAVVDNIAAALGGSESCKGENEGDPRTHLDVWSW